MTKLRIMLVLMMLLAIFVPAAAAQEETFGLSAEDYARLGNAITASGEAATSLAFDFTVNIDVTGQEGQNVAATGSGVFGTNAEGGVVAQLSLNGTSADESGTIDIIVIDNILYLNDGSGWVGQDIEEALGQFSSMSPIPLDSIASGDIAQDPAAMEGMTEAMTALSEMDPAEFISMSNAGVVEESTHFTIDLALQDFLSSPAFTSLLSAGAAMSGDESMTAQMEGMGQIMAMMFQDSYLTINYYVNSDDLVDGFGVDFGLSVNPAMMGGGADAQPINIAFVLDVSNFEYGADTSGIVAPEGATMS